MIRFTNSLRYLKAIVLFTVLSSVVLLCYSFSSNPAYTNPGIIATGSTSLNNAIIALDQSATDYKFGKITLDSLQMQLIATRVAYKKIEFYLAFHYPEYVKGNINGAPLMQIEKEGTRPKVVDPVGLQVLDELVFSEEAKDEKSQISILTKKLHSAYSTLYAELDKNKQAGRFGVAAMRLQLVRILSLGITGFDTPGSLNAFQEAQASLQGIQQYIKENYKEADTKTVLPLLNKAIQVLDKPVTFNAFDRLSFIKLYLDPVYKELGKFDDLADAEYMKETIAWNPKSTSIFAEDFLDPYYFSELKREEDTDDLRNLGKTLFYDTAISNDGKVSCATCHQPGKAFSDGLAKSASNVQGKSVLRNAPTLLNAVYADRYFYDLRAFTLEQQAEHVIFNKDEFNTAYAAIIKKLKENEGYTKKFKTVFGKEGMTRENFSKALASYVLSLRSFNSDFDKYIRGESATLAPEIKNGFNLFMGKANCATCHFAPTFSGLVPPFYNENESEILGVLANPTAKVLDADSGRLDNQIYNEYAWIYEKSFKTTTVRNAALTAPYFHNGAYKTLEDVIDFYNKGGGEGMGFTVKNQTLAPDVLDLTESEKKDLIAFITSLNDVSAAKEQLKATR